MAKDEQARLEEQARREHGLFQRRQARASLAAIDARLRVDTAEMQSAARQPNGSRAAGEPTSAPDSAGLDVPDSAIIDHIIGAKPIPASPPTQ